MSFYFTEPPDFQYFSYILPYRLNSFTRSLEVSTLLILEGKRLAREFASTSLLQVEKGGSSVFGLYSPGDPLRLLI